MKIEITDAKLRQLYNSLNKVGMAVFDLDNDFGSIDGDDNLSKGISKVSAEIQRTRNVIISIFENALFGKSDKDVATYKKCKIIRGQYLQLIKDMYSAKDSKDWHLFISKTIECYKMLGELCPDKLTQDDFGKIVCDLGNEVDKKPTFRDYNRISNAFCKFQREVCGVYGIKEVFSIKGR